MPEISPGQKKRISRIKRRAVLEVRQAFERGDISARRADELLYLDPTSQRKELAAILADRETRERTAHVAAETINTHLASHPGKVDLTELGQKIRAAIA
jgi:hypothetical protein